MAHARHLSLHQLKVMSAIETCRTAALGGHVEACEDCGHWRVADIAWQNKALVYDLLFRAASETLLTIAADPRHLGARIGITAVLHTWGSAMTHHPHVHMIVPGGGIALDGSRWIFSRPAFLLPVRVLGKLFRRLFLTRLTALHDAGRLAFFGAISHYPRIRSFAIRFAQLQSGTRA